MADNGEQQRKSVSEMTRMFEGEKQTKWETEPNSKYLMTGQKPSGDIKGKSFEQAYLENEIRMVLIGKTGSGKSATGNSILDNKQHGSYFQMSLLMSSMTSKCKQGTTNRCGKKIVLVDTPGLFDTGLQEREIEKEIQKCIGIVSPGPHAFLLVLRLDVRFTDEEFDTIKKLQRIFGDDLIKYLIIVFTRRDQFETCNISIEEYINSKEMPARLQEILKITKRRYVAFNNKAVEKENDEQVQNLVSVITRMINDNGGNHYTSEMFQAVECVIQDEIKSRLQKELSRLQQLRVKDRIKHEENRVRLSEIVETMKIKSNDLAKQYHEQRMIKDEEIKRITERETQVNLELRKSIKTQKKLHQRNQHEMEENAFSEMRKAIEEQRIKLEKEKRKLENDKRKQLEEEKNMKCLMEKKIQEFEKEKEEKEKEIMREKSRECEKLRDTVRKEVEDEEPTLLGTVGEAIVSTMGPVVGAVTKAAGWLWRYFTH